MIIDMIEPFLKIVGDKKNTMMEKISSCIKTALQFVIIMFGKQALDFAIEKLIKI